MPRGRILVGSLLGLALVTAGSTAAMAQGRGFGPPTLAPSKLRSVPAETMAAKAKDPAWKAPRTPWGAPDLTGIWTSDDMRGIPAARPASQKDSETLTPEERAHAELVAQERFLVDSAVARGLVAAIAKGLPIPTRAPAGMEVYTGAPVEGREAVREFGTGK
jgi:hypothetical protein